MQLGIAFHLNCLFILCLKNHVKAPHGQSGLGIGSMVGLLLVQSGMPALTSLIKVYQFIVGPTSW